MNKNIGVVRQVKYIIPPDVGAKLLTGEYTRFGSVVRDSSRIVCHLKEVETKGTKQSIMAIGIGTVLLGLGVGATVLISKAIEKRKLKKYETVVSKFNEAMDAYLLAIQEASLTQEILDNLLACISELEKLDKNGNAVIQISQEQLTTIIDILSEYTGELSRENSYKYKSRKRGRSASIADIRSLLETQKEIFLAA